MLLDVSIGYLFVCDMNEDVDGCCCVVCFLFVLFVCVRFCVMGFCLNWCC